MGYQLGLAGAERMRRLEQKNSLIGTLEKQLKTISVGPDDEEVEQLLANRKTSVLREKTSLWNLLRRPEIKMADLVDARRIPENEDLEVLEQVEIACKYEGYIKKQIDQIEKFDLMESKRLSPDLDYSFISGLSNEARYKLTRVKPQSIGQATRISGVSPADITVLLIHLEKMKRA
jgi:tRNA uridine 5-carboxymethylaminomethyl modification enzyme